MFLTTQTYFKATLVSAIKNTELLDIIILNPTFRKLIFVELEGKKKTFLPSNISKIFLNPAP